MTLTSQGLHLHIMQTKRCHTRMEAESESSESDPPIAISENDLTDDFLMDDNNDHSQLDANPINDFLMQVDNNDNLQLEPNPIKEGEAAPTEDEVRVEDEDEYRWIENYPEPVGNTHGQDLSKFESLRKEQMDEGLAPWFPFESEDEWELARWLMTSGISQKKIDSFLKLHKVSTSPHLKQLTTYIS